MDLGQLEEWCANELSGMSKARILSILNGKAMVESSDTTESDNSGMLRIQDEDQSFRLLVVVERIRYYIEIFL